MSQHMLMFCTNIRLFNLTGVHPFSCHSLTLPAPDTQITNTDFWPYIVVEANTQKFSSTDTDTDTDDGPYARLV